MQAVLHGTNLSKVQGINNLHNRTARQLLLDIDPIETERIVLTTTPIYNSIWDYACPADLKGNRIIDISPQYFRTADQVLTQAYQQPFDINKNLLNGGFSDFTIQFNTAVKTLRINDTTLPAQTVIDTCTATTGWSATAPASNLTVDNVNWVANGGSLKFDIAAGAPATGVISKTLASTLDLTNQLNQSSFFFYVYFPSVTGITSVSIRWGSSSSAYYTRTLTTTNEGNAFAIGWNLLRADWLGATVVGSPTITAINYIYVGVTTDGTAFTGVNVDNIVSVMGLYRTIRYYSKYLFRTAAGAFQETVTDNSNLINLDTESYNLYMNLLAFYTTQQVQGLDATFFDSNFWGQEYMKNKTRYTSLNKSQVQKPRDSYYTPQQGGFGKYLGRWRF